MLTPQQLREIVETMQPVLDDLNTWIVKDIIRRVMARMKRGEGFELTATDISQAQVIQDIGGHIEDLQSQLIAFTKVAADEVRQVFQYAGLTAYNADAEMYRQGGLEVPPLRQSPRIQQILQDTYERTQGELRNYTRTTATATQQKLFQVLDKAHIQVMSGATSYAVAVREAVNELANHQAYVRYPTGHTDTLEVAVLRAVRTGTAQASGNMSMGTMEQYGWEIILTSAHLGARYGDGGENPGNHFWWQGRFFSRTGKDPRFPDFVASTGYGTGEGLCGWNCRHSFGPGDGKHNPWRQYDKEENKRAYDLSQQQRKKERDIRNQKKKVEAFKEAVDAAQSDDVRKVMQEALKEEQAKLTHLQKDYGNFCDENGLKRQAFRLETAKAKQREAQRAYYEEPAVKAAPVRTSTEAVPPKAPEATHPSEPEHTKIVPITPRTEKPLPIEPERESPVETVQVPHAPEPTGIEQEETSASETTEEPPKNYEDVTDNWYPDATPGSHEVQDLQSYEANGQTYVVDGKNVLFDYTPHEKAVGEMLARDVGGETFMVPRVNEPDGVSTPDYLFNGHSYDLKTLQEGAGNNTIYNRVQESAKKRQAEGYIIDVTKSGLDDATILRQVDKIFWSTHTKSVTEIVIVRNLKIERVFRRIIIES